MRDLTHRDPNYEQQLLQRLEDFRRHAENLGAAPRVVQGYALCSLVEEAVEKRVANLETSLRTLEQSLDLCRRAAERRAAQLRVIACAIHSGELRRDPDIGGSILMIARMDEIRPTDLVLDPNSASNSDREERWSYVEASAPPFPGVAPSDGRRGWMIHTISLSEDGSVGASTSGAGFEPRRIRRILDLRPRVQRWTCPTCLCSNLGDACNGCGSTPTERAVYVAHVTEVTKASQADTEEGDRG